MSPDTASQLSDQQLLGVCGKRDADGDPQEITTALQCLRAAEALVRAGDPRREPDAEPGSAAMLALAYAWLGREWVEQGDLIHSLTQLIGLSHPRVTAIRIAIRASHAVSAAMSFGFLDRKESAHYTLLSATDYGTQRAWNSEIVQQAISQAADCGDEDEDDDDHEGEGKDVVEDASVAALTPSAEEDRLPQEQADEMALEADDDHAAAGADLDAVITETPPTGRNTRGKSRGGQPPLSPKHARQRDEILAAWDRARAAGVSQKAFCRDHSIHLESLTRFVSWRAQRRRRYGDA